MPKRYYLDSKPDMDRFVRDTSKQVTSLAKDIAATKAYSIKCPRCAGSATVAQGRNICPSCGMEIRLTPP